MKAHPHPLPNVIWSYTTDPKRRSAFAVFMHDFHHGSPSNIHGENEIDAAERDGMTSKTILKNACVGTYPLTHPLRIGGAHIIFRPERQARDVYGDGLRGQKQRRWRGAVCFL